MTLGDECRSVSLRSRIFPSDNNCSGAGNSMKFSDTFDVCSLNWAVQLSLFDCRSFGFEFLCVCWIVCI